MAPTDEAPAEEAVDVEAAPEIETLFDVPVTVSLDQQVLHPSVDELVDTAQALRADGYSMSDLTAVDYLTHPGRSGMPASVALERFEVVVGVIHLGRRERLRLRVQVEENNPVVPTLFDVWPGTEALEREVFDMFGITFSDHPDMTRVLMPEDWVGHPLRKDYAIGSIPVQFKEPSANR